MSTGKRKSNFGSTGTFSDDLDNWKVGSKMDSTLINTFRNEVNDQDLVLQMYHSRDGKALWNIICSAMDWIDVVVGEIDVHKLLRGNDNKSSIHFITFISCADVLWEAIQQLHRVFFCTDSIPFADDSSVFKNKLFPATDNEYFKTIRACFAAHPINLSDNFSGTGKKERRYASWSGGGFGNGDFSVFLYSNQVNEKPVPLDIYFDELITFSQKRYDYLYTIIDEMNRQKRTYLTEWCSKKIPQNKNPLTQIEILIEEVSYRYYSHDYYNYVLKKLQIIFSTTITAPKNKLLVEKYRAALMPEIKEIYENLQNMISKELQSEADVNDSYPFVCQYAFSKLSDAVYGDGHPSLINTDAFQSHLQELVDFSEIFSVEELYTVVCAGFFAANAKVSYK